LNLSYSIFQATEVTEPVRVSGAFTRLTEIWESILAMGPALLASIFVFLIVAMIGHAIARWTSFWRKMAPNMFLAEILSQAVRLGFIILGLILALEMMDAGNLIGAILGAAGITGIAIGFAVKDTVDNYVSSLMLSFNQPFRPNDFIEIEGLKGRVIRMTSRATILMTPDGNHLRIPNAKVYKSPIINYTRIPERRFQFNIGVKPSDDPQAAIQLGIAEISKFDFIKNDPAPSGHIVDIGPSTIDLAFFAWIDQGDTSFSRARSLAIRSVKLALETAGFSIPDPSYNINLSTKMPILKHGIQESVDDITAVCVEEDRPIKLERFDVESEAKADHFIEEKVEAERKRLLGAHKHEDMLKDETPKA